MIATTMYPQNMHTLRIFSMHAQKIKAEKKAAKESRGDSSSSSASSTSSESSDSEDEEARARKAAKRVSCNGSQLYFNRE